jgi:thiol:disulfide interchange protein DsbD
LDPGLPGSFILINMRKVIVSLLLLFCSYMLSAQDSLLVKWDVRVEKKTDKEVIFLFNGKIAPDWHVYAMPSTSQGLEGLKMEMNAVPLSPRETEWLAKSVSMKDPIFEMAELEVLKDSVKFRKTIQFEKVPNAVMFKLNYDLGSEESFIQEEQEMTVVVEEGAVIKPAQRIKISSINLNAPLSNCTTSGAVEEGAGNSGLFNIFLLGFLGGLVALLTPCVFPMIPLTVSFFTKRSKTRKEGIRNATLYGLFIFMIYVILSLPFHFLDSLDPEILNNISTNVVLNVIFFLIFIFFAFSFFGYYEITLPSAFSSNTDSRAGTGNVLGIFFMALTLSIVSFSCTGPILGSLLAGSLSGDGGAIQLTIGMGGFGLALAMPFALFALFPNWLNSLPKSGGWLNTVKVVLGFLELALAFKFLSNADLVKHWGLLKREIFIGIWIIIGALLTAYLLGFIRFKHDDPKEKISPLRKMLGLTTLVFTLYLLPGVTNSSWANLTLISGFPPPLYYSVYDKPDDCVLGLNCSRDYEKGLQMAREQQKPILIDFTGYACVNCRRMEENIWSRPDVYALMKEKFIVISLYVDDKQLLPAEERLTFTTADGVVKKIKTVGDLWATFETENFRNNAQPLYAILDNEERLLTVPVGYSPSEAEYLDWLRCGLATFEKNKKASP